MLVIGDDELMITAAVEGDVDVVEEAGHVMR
jgi:hypothetical protein